MARTQTKYESLEVILFSGEYTCFGLAYKEIYVQRIKNLLLTFLNINSLVSMRLIILSIFPSHQKQHRYKIDASHEGVLVGDVSVLWRYVSVVGPFYASRNALMSHDYFYWDL